ncbi:hypothetical protein AHiyo6_01960 [Arthrobacter sp. Hiyo6]|nr:hypothetical protein AHiyo6_01960 [Arthrobacter sp. Hiyo6]
MLADVESQAGKPFKYEDKLVTARAKCAELDEKLKASIEPPKPASESVASASEGDVDPVVARLRRLQAASFPSAPSNTHQTAGHPQQQASSGPAPSYSRDGGLGR